MYSTSGAIIIFLVALLVGIGLGIILSRLVKRIGGRSSALERKLADTEKQLADYQNQVTEHFIETSRRVNTLTKNYKDVHEYLATSAAKLANPDMNKDGFSAQITLTNDHNNEAISEIIDQPATIQDSEFNKDSETKQL